MTAALLLPVLKSQPKSVNLSHKGLKKVPKAIGQLRNVLHLELQGNKIKTLPAEFGYLVQLEYLNVGKNELEELPEALAECTGLIKLHVFANHLRTLKPNVLDIFVEITYVLPTVNFKLMTHLNLNNNQLVTLPAEMRWLVNLQYLSMDHNYLEELPCDLCGLRNLTELHVAYNRLNSLPLEFGYLFNLQVLYLQKNRLKELPESLGKCYNLRMLDISANELRIFPTEFNSLPLKELYCEENPLLQHVPIHSVQEEEVLSLKEVAARFVMKERKDRWSLIRKNIEHYPAISEMLSQSSKCALCSESFLNTWLECVQFLEPCKTIRTNKAADVIPVRALLCSYKCFNAPGHRFYGVAFP